MTTVLVLPENLFNIEVYSRSTRFHFEFNLSHLSFKAIYVVLAYSKPKILFVGQPLWPTFFQASVPQLF